MMNRNILIWLGILVFFAFIYATKAVLLPFVAGLAVAYLLDPLADKLEAVKFPRWLATVTILALFFIGFSGIIIGIAPIVKVQIIGIAKKLPAYIESLQPLVNSYISDLSNKMHVDLAKGNSDLLGSMVQQNVDRITSFLGGFIGRGMAIFNLLTLVLITPVVAFFLLRDWDLLVAKVNSWLPKRRGETIRTVARDIDKALAGFVRGQTMVSITMAVLYAIGWTIAGLDFAIILGLLAGILAYIPFVGALMAAAFAVLVGFGQFSGDWSMIWPIVLVFIIVQAIEGAFLTPKFIGDRVGLHPVWVLFAIFAGGEIMGFVGVLIALPMAAAIGVLVRFGIAKYLDKHVHLPDEAKSDP